MSYSQLKKVFYSVGSPGALFRDPRKIYRILKEKYPKSKLSFKNVKQFMDNQEVNSLHRNAKRHYKRNTIHVSVPHFQFATDLIDFSTYAKYNGNYKYILTMIDCFTKKAYVSLLKSKSGKDVSSALDIIFKSLKFKPKVLQADYGSEYFNLQTDKVLKKHNIKLFGSSGIVKNAVIERFNRTLQELIWSYFDITRQREYAKIIPKIVNTYNTTIHSSTGYSPNKINYDNAHLAYKKLYGKTLIKKRKKSKFKKGDIIRLNRLHNMYEKKFEQRWSRAVYIVGSHPYYTTLGKLPTYKIIELDGTILPGRFYENEMLKLDRKNYLDNFKFPYELLRKDKKGTFVTWLGYDKKYNSYL